MDSTNSRLARRGLALGAALVAFALSAQAHAATGSLTYIGQQSSAATMDGARGVTVSPDGKTVYVAGQDSDTVVAFARGAGGALTQIGCFEDAGAPDSSPACAETEGLDSARFVAVSPDNRHVYVTGGDDDAVVAFQRDLDTGTLSAPACFGVPAGCTSVPVPLDGAEGIGVAPNGGQVYVAVQNVSAVVSLTRDAGSGALSAGPAPNCFSFTVTAGCTQTPGIQHPRGLAVSPDGTGVYVAAATSNGIKAFRRDTGNGALSDAGFAGGAPLAVGVVVSPDSRNVYAGAFTGSAVRIYTRDTTTAALTQGGCLKDAVSGTATGCAVAEGLAGAEGVAVAPDGASVYASGASDHALVAMTRDLGGGIGALECWRDTPGGGGCATAAGLGSTRDVAVSPDGLNVYAASTGDDGIVTFQRTPGTPSGGGGGGGGGGTATPEPPRPDPNCVNPVTLLVSCADPYGPPGICGPTASILPQCNYPTVLPTVCGPSNTLLTACGPGSNYVAACGGTGTVLPVCSFPPPQLPQVCGPTGTLLPPCTGANNPVLFCGGSGTALPPCNLPPGAIQGTVGPNGGEVEVTVGCPRANATGQGRAQNCTIDAVIADHRRALRSSLYSYLERWAAYFVDSNLHAPGLTADQRRALRLDDLVAMVHRGSALLDKAFDDADRGDPFRRSTAIANLVSLGGPPRLRGSYPSVANMQTRAGEFVDQVAKTIDGYRHFLDYQRSPTARSTAGAAAATGLVKPLARKRVKVKVGKRKRVTIKLSRKAVKQLRKGVAKRKAVAVRLLVTYKSRPRPVIRMIDFPIRVAKPAKAKGKAKRGPAKRRR